MQVKRATAVLFTLLLFAPSIWAGDIEEGQELFKWECYKTCHFYNNPKLAIDQFHAPDRGDFIINAKAAILGPDLRGVVGAPAGRRTAEGYRHSHPFLDAAPNIVWTEELLDKWLEDSQKVIPGTWMSVKFPDPDTRRKIIAWLKTYKDKK